MSVCCECCVLSGRGSCDGPIPRPEESYRLWCAIVCDLSTSSMRRPWPALGCSARNKTIKKDCWTWFRVVCSLNHIQNFRNMLIRQMLDQSTSYTFFSSEDIFGTTISVPIQCLRTLLSILVDFQKFLIGFGNWLLILQLDDPEFGQGRRSKLYWFWPILASRFQIPQRNINTEQYKHFSKK
jgi:hypothetical protein